MSACNFTIILPKKTIKKLGKFLIDYPENEVINHLYIDTKHSPPTLHLINKEPYVGTSTNVNVDQNTLPTSLKKMFIDCHTHPPAAYEEFNTNIGYPSNADYCTILENIVKNQQLFHILVAVEGLYVIGLHPNRIKEISTSKNKTQLYEKWMKKYEKYINKISHTKQGKNPSNDAPSCWKEGNDTMCIRGVGDYVIQVNDGELFYIQFVPHTNGDTKLTVSANKCNRFNFNINNI